MASVIGSIMFFATTFALLRPERLEASLHAKNTEAPGAHNLDPSWVFQNPEMDRLITELRLEKDSLQLRETQLKTLEARLQNERTELTTITQTVLRLQKDFDQNVLRLKEEEVANCKKLAKLHAAMSPEGCANIFREMPDDEVVKIIAYMKTDEVGPVLDTLGRLGKTEAKRAALLTDRLRRTMSATPTAKISP